MSHRFHIVDVFAEAAYGGNQLAVVLDAGDLSTDEMQRLALETNYSETTFIEAPTEAPGGGYPVRIFTPSRELPFAGHPTLGTAWIIRQHVAGGRADRIELKLGVGRVPVTFEKIEPGPDVAWLTAPPIELGPEVDRARMAAVLGLDPDDIDDRAPVQQLSSGIEAVMVPLRGCHALGKARFDLHAFGPLAREGFMPHLYLFCTEARAATDDISARFFFDANGPREDAATGSATASFGRYLLEYDIMGSRDLSLRIEQGFEMGRPSMLRLRAREAGGSVEIRVGGRVIPTAHGEFL